MNAATSQSEQRPTNLLPVVGIDVGQKRDPTAIAVAELEYRRIPDPTTEFGRKESHYLVRFVERLPLGTPYPDIARRLSEICSLAREKTGRQPQVYVDATGVGTPVVDLLKAQAKHTFIWAVYFTHGDRRTEEIRERKITLGKAFLVSRLQTLLQSRRLHLPESSEARALAQELLDFEIRVDEDANDKYGAFRVGTHDDLVTALGLAVHKEPVVTVYASDD